MAEHGSENYLDNLLSSVSGGEEKSAAESVTPASGTGASSFEQEILGRPDAGRMAVAKKEEEFMREFEQELLGGEIPDYIKNYDDQKKNKGPAKSQESLSQTIDSMLDNMPNVEPQPELEQAVGEFDAQPHTEDGEVDLSGMSDSDLMDMLSEDQDLADLGDMLAIDEEGQPIEDGDPIGDFAEQEMESQEKAKEPASKNEEKGGKKEGFLAKLKRILFGDDDDDDEEEKIAIKNGKGTGAAALAAENDEILKELDGKPPKKAKKKKEKKPKPKKAKKEKKPKPKKPPKPKKEKPPAEPDNSPPLPKGPVVAIIVMTASLFGLVILVTHLLGYQANVSEAEELDAAGDYLSAFNSLQGLDIKDSDAEFYNKLQAASAVYEKYNDYLIFDSYGKKEMALDSLVCAYGRYNMNKKYASAYDFESEFEELRSKIVAALLGEFGMTEDEALQIYDSSTRKDYTLALKTKLKQLGIEEDSGTT